MRQSFVLLMAAVCMAFSLNACKKGGKNDDKPTEKPGEIRGMGDKPGTPEGEPYILPTGIAVVGQIKGDFCDTTYLRGSGQFVSVCVALANNNTTDVTLTLPSGLIILAENAEEDQHGIVVQETRIVLKAKKITRVGLGAYCINSSKHPSFSSSIYTFGPVTASTLIRQLLDKLKNKKVNMEDYADEDAYIEAESIVQGLIWNLTDGEGQGDLYIRMQEEQLPKLPNK